ncbi:MAG: Zn-ribbon domain-containing OB-fold protein [Candidatus Geothermincolia bacterium]
MSAQQERIVANVGVPLDFTYNYRVGPYIERYIKGLGEKKILGSKCPGDGTVIVPPRKICGQCSETMSEWVEVGPEGTIENFTIGHVTLNKGLVEKADADYVLALIKLDGASSLLPALVKGIAPSDVENGMRVKAVFKDPAEDSLADLSHFELAG